MLDVAAIQPQMPGIEEHNSTWKEETKPCWQAPQILHRKFYRTDKSITRDAFDFTVAADKDPRALELAVNSLDMTDTRIPPSPLFRPRDRAVQLTAPRAWSESSLPKVIGRSAVAQYPPFGKTSLACRAPTPRSEVAELVVLVYGRLRWRGYPLTVGHYPISGAEVSNAR